MNGVPFGWGSYTGRSKAAAIALLAAALVALQACGGSGGDSTEPAPTSPPAVSAQPTAAPTPEPAPAATPTSAPVESPTPAGEATPQAEATEPEVIPDWAYTSSMDPSKHHGTCDGLEYDAQKEKLVEIAYDLFAGTTNFEERERLQQIPNARDSRRGGIWLVIDFNGDEFDSLLVKKNRLDLQMRDAYEAFYNAGCADLGEVSITAIQKEVTTREVGPSTVLPIVVFKTKMTKAQADEVDWENKDDIDFNEVWREEILNPRWREGLRELQKDG